MSTSSDRSSDQALADELAHEAGRFLVDLRDAAPQGGRALGDVGDWRANELILARLDAARPGDVVLSEESPDPPERLTSDRLWIIDPLDGTRGYSSRWSQEWGVHIALVEYGEVVAATVGLPDVEVTLSMYETRLAPRAHSGPIQIVVSDARAPRVAWEVAEALDAQLVGMGGAGFKAGAVVRGLADVYLHMGAMREWDAAAPTGVGLAAGAHVSRFDGTAIEFNQPEPIVWDMVLCRPEWAEPVLAALADIL